MKPFPAYVPMFLLFSIATFGQRSDKVQQLLESKLSEFHKSETVGPCLQLIVSQKLDTVLSQVPIGFPLLPEENDFIITGIYGLRNHPIEKRIKKHQGLDIAATVGTPVIATGYGHIRQIKKSPTGYGNLIIIQHAFGFRSLYAHLSEIMVKKGQKVGPGDIIGLMGATGKTTGSHLHYEIHKNKNVLNPKFNILLKRKLKARKEGVVTVSEKGDKLTQTHRGGYNH